VAARRSGAGLPSSQVAPPSATVVQDFPSGLRTEVELSTEAPSPVRPSAERHLPVLPVPATHTLLHSRRGPTTNRLSTEAVVADSHQGEPGDRTPAPVPTAATGRGAPKAISVVDLEAEEELLPTEEKSPDTTEEITHIRKIKSKVDNWMSEHNVSPGVGCPSETSQDSVQTCGDSSVPSSAGQCNRKEALAKAVVRSQATPLQAPDPVTPKKKTGTAKFVEDYFRDLRAKEAEEKKQEQERLNAERAANPITIDSDNEADGDDEVVIEAVDPPKKAAELVDLCDSD